MRPRNYFRKNSRLYRNVWIDKINEKIFQGY